ncbi:FAD-binding oxidoreductase [Citreicella sp. C3M06]|uniref:NAD(P)/FAD-dependent oxidoreductase n=1 Tax=Citreicella sp. C3M06 TaxID=2841564 RepID=UPI001C08AB50|nr:FAD-binding oxidoreductase [Citreicella sp. C3M06]MBU2962429.1 FAD-binding oxidoreductase [Citreicella sp. C3M06]
MPSAPDTNLWQASAREHVSGAPFEADAVVDLAIIGGGFTGCSAALEAARRGAKVALFEGRKIGHGGSGRNVGLANAGLWLKPDEIIAKLGAGPGRALIDRLGGAPDQVFDLIAREGIRCEATRNGTLHCAHAPSGMDDLRERHRQGNAAGAPLQLLDAAEAQARTGSRAVHGALFDPRAGTIQPLSYVRGLARAAQQAGATLHEASPVSSVVPDGSGWRITCNGHRLRAGALLLASGAYHLPLGGPPAPAYVPVWYGQFATVPMPQPARAKILPRLEGCWDTALVMSSFRTDNDGRMIIGAMGNLDGPGAGIHAAWARRKLAQLFPELADLPFVHGWSGRIAMTSDHIPKITALGETGLGCHGYSGRGIGPGTVFGTACAEALLSGNRASLPLAPVPRHNESLTALKASYYEFGATLTHAISAR